MDDSRIKTARELLSAYFDDEKLRRGGRYAEFFSSWKYLVGDQLAAHSRVADIERGILIVEAEHPGWIQLLQLRQSVILDGIAARFPELGLRSIVFRLGSSRPQGTESEFQSKPPAEKGAAVEKAWAEEKEPPEKGGEQQARSGTTLEDIPDPALRDLLSGLRKTLRGGS